MNEKKGGSNKKWVIILIVSLVILIFIGGVYYYVAKDNFWTAQERRSINKCLNAVLDLSIETSGSTCIASDGRILIELERGSKEFNLVYLGYGVVFENNSHYAGKILSPELDSDSKKLYFLDDINFLDASSINIFPVVQIGQVEKTCDVADEVNLEPCENE
ncbi:hypothetical protein CMI37_27790 [Candidatus Pacearchaeota archaeon]|nr:hypothetical protein [Candidatus Pacearchaeota archaeon]|tara:strand:+ start:4339 stop:4821 length:483 start_codon:yes stop_codon:yes gene_type:complete